MEGERRLAVLGSPIHHSLSPLIHRTAYEFLGIPWRYDAIEVTSDQLPGFLDSCGPEWRGLSLTMPLKYAVEPFLSSRDRIAEQTGVTNTVLFRDGERHGFNTDVVGIERVVRERLVGRQPRVMHILGNGATAVSALVACVAFDPEVVVVRARNQSASQRFRELGASLDVHVKTQSFGATGPDPDVVISTIPGSAAVTGIYSDHQMRNAFLLDVAYDPWPTALAESWIRAGGRVSSGLPMLVYQAVRQMRIFIGGDAALPLSRENDVELAIANALERSP